MLTDVHCGGCLPRWFGEGQQGSRAAGDPHVEPQPSIKHPSAHVAPQQTATPIVSSSCELPISNAPHIPPPSTVLLSKSTPSTVVRLHKTNNNPGPDLWSLFSSFTTPPPPTTISKLPDRSYPRSSSSQDGWCSSTRWLLQPGRRPDPQVHRTSRCCRCHSLRLCRGCSSTRRYPHGPLPREGTEVSRC